MESLFLQELSASTSNGSFPWYWILIGLAGIIAVFVGCFYCVFKIYVEGDDWETETEKQANAMSQMQMGSMLQGSVAS